MKTIGQVAYESFMIANQIYNYGEGWELLTERDRLVWEQTGRACAAATVFAWFHYNQNKPEPKPKLNIRHIEQ